MPSHPARMTRLKGITAHHAPHSECPKPCGFREAGKPGKSTLDQFSLLVGQAKRDAILVCAEPVILLPGRPFTLTHIHEICTKFNEGYTLHRMPTMGMHPGIARFGLHWRVSQAESECAPKSRGNHKASGEPARTSVLPCPTFVPLLTTEGLCILLAKSFQRERTRLMLEIFILLPVNKRPGRVSYVRGGREIGTPFDGGI